MTQMQSNCYALPVKAVDKLSKGFGGKLLPVLTMDEVAAPATALDSFDQSLQRAGLLLLETGTSFELLTPDGLVLSQPAQRNGQFVSDFAEGPVKSALKDISPLRCLLPVGPCALQRGSLVLIDDDQKTRCHAHLSFLTGDGGKGAVVVTLQGLHGFDESLAQLRKHVEACGGTQLSRRRFYGDICPSYFAYDARPQVNVKPDGTAFDTATDIIAAYIPVVRANEPGIIADHDTEFLHDYRTALRKIRSVLSLFKGVYGEGQTAALKARFADLMEPTGRLRDLDVYLLERQRYYDMLPKTLHGGLDTMFGMFSAERKVRKAILVHHLDSKAYEVEISSLARLFRKRRKLDTGPKAELRAHDYARDLIWRRYRKICRIAEGIGPETDDAAVHVLRIHCKKLRYLMEFFGPLFPKPEFRALLKPLKQLQDNLGLYNDHSVQRVSLQEFLSRQPDWPDGANIEVAQSVGALTTILQRLQLEERGRVVGTLVDFNSKATKKTFRHLFHGRGDRK